MPKSPQESDNPDFKANKDLPRTSKGNLDDTSIDEHQKHQRRQSITFDKDAALSPSSKSKLQKALIDENEGVYAKDSQAKKAWVDSNTKELHEAFAKITKAELSTSGISQSADTWSVREGTTQDLRSTLTQIFEKYGPIVMMYKGHDALGRHWVSGWKATSEQMAVVVCIEKEEVRNKHPVSADNKQAGTDENSVLNEKGKKT